MPNAPRDGMLVSPTKLSALNALARETIRIAIIARSCAQLTVTCAHRQPPAQYVIRASTSISRERVRAAEVIAVVV